MNPRKLINISFSQFEEHCHYLLYVSIVERVYVKEPNEELYTDRTSQEYVKQCNESMIVNPICGNAVCVLKSMLQSKDAYRVVYKCIKK
jgi:ribonucleotide reductase beta subunit family protein with ferritin-like domain